MTKVVLVGLVALTLLGCQSQQPSGWPERQSCEDIYPNISEHVCDGSDMTYREYQQEFGE